MKNLTMPSRDTDRDDLEENIHTYVYNGQVRGYEPTGTEIDRAIELYDHYDEVGGRVDNELKADDLDPALVNSVKAAFSKTYSLRPLAHLREHLFRGVDDCPICGIDPPTQLDHFLPKSSFGVLAIYSRNLVPVCASCNHTKSSDVPANPNEEFVHAYFDIVPDTDFLEANINLAADGLDVEFEFIHHPDMPEQLRERLTHQFESLGLEQRYRREINVYVGGHATSFHTLFDIGGSAAIKAWLEAQSVQEARRFHRNDWRAVVFRSLGNHDDFCDGGFAVAFPLL
ncbi:MAG: HNH endonuclease signature motif containing protein [Sulfitobacter sp.]